MALTMSRTRTQTTLTTLATLISNVHGELVFLDALLATTEVAGQADVLAMLESRRLKLMSDRAALYETVRQFDARIEPERIGDGDTWRKRFGRARGGEAGFIQRYIRQ